VGPVRLPDYVDRPQIVTRLGDNELQLAEFDRWAEPVGVNFTRVLIENLSALFATQRIQAYPWKGDEPADWRIVVDVLQFDAVEGSDVILSARWTVLAGGKDKVLLTRRSRLTDQATGDDYAALVAAQSRAVAALSREIADAIESVGDGA
jgi:uncharacterized lipoprotein YmbA